MWICAMCLRSTHHRQRLLCGLAGVPCCMGEVVGYTAGLVQDLDDILRHGAEELFAEEGADEAAKEALRRKRITYDDAALAALLDREARLKEAEGDDDGGGGGFMDDFKARATPPLWSTGLVIRSVSSTYKCDHTVDNSNRHVRQAESC